MQVCRMCGTEAADDATECAKCGERLPGHGNVYETIIPPGSAAFRAGAIVLLVGAVLQVLLFFIALLLGWAYGGRLNWDLELYSAMRLLGIVNLIAMAVSLTGKGLCIAVPTETNSRELFVTSMVFDVIVFCGVVWISLRSTAPFEPFGEPRYFVFLSLAVGVLWFVAGIVRLIAFRVYGRHTNAPRIAKTAVDTMGVLIATVVTPVVFLVISWTVKTGRVAEASAIGVLVAIVVLGLATAVKYCILLGRVAATE